MASVMCGPLFSITHSARSANAASVISARAGRPDFASDSSTWVPRMVGTRAACARARIWPGTSPMRWNPSSTARSPRAIMMPMLAWRMPATRISGRFSKAGMVSIFSTIPRPRVRAASSSSPASSCSRAIFSSSSRTCATSSGVRMKLIAATCPFSATNRRFRASSSVSAGTGRSVVGRLMPLWPARFCPPGLARVTFRRASWCLTTPPSPPPSPTSSTAVTSAAMAPSSKSTGCPTCSAATASGSVHDRRGTSPLSSCGTDSTTSEVMIISSPTSNRSLRTTAGTPVARVFS